MHQAMTTLGYRSAPSSAHLIDGIDEEFLASHDAFFDNPIPFLLDEWEQRFPSARYVVTWRPVDTWLPSMAWLFDAGLDRLSPAMRELGNRVHRHVYGVDQFDHDRLADIHQRHYEMLRQWSAGREDVLWLDQQAGFSWEPLCRFLGQPVPKQPFPTANPATPTTSTSTPTTVGAGRRRRPLHRLRRLAETGRRFDHRRGED